jgi:hypothetical protein
MINLASYRTLNAEKRLDKLCVAQLDLELRLTVLFGYYFLRGFCVTKSAGSSGEFRRGCGPTGLGREQLIGQSSLLQCPQNIAACRFFRITERIDFREQTSQA